MQFPDSGGIRLRWLDAGVDTHRFHSHPVSPIRALSAMPYFADRAFTAHAAASSQTLSLFEELRAAGEPLLTVADPSNPKLMESAGTI